VTASLGGPQQIHDLEPPRTGRPCGLVAAGGADPIETEATPESTQLKVNMLLSCLPRLKNARSTLDPRPSGRVRRDLPHQRGLRPAATDAYRRGRGCGAGADFVRVLLLLTLGPQHSGHGPGRHRCPGPDPDPVGSARARVAVVCGQKRTVGGVSAALRSLNCVLAEPTEDVIMGTGNGDLCLETRTSLNLQVDLGLLGGNIFYRSLHWPWTPRQSDAGFWGVGTAYKRVLVCGAVARGRGWGRRERSGTPGHNAAQRVLEL
jgi:hypothetical protein